jgi:hypothetical protein
MDSTQKLKDFLYPRFSELNAFALWLAMAYPLFFNFGKSLDLRDLASLYDIGQKIFIFILLFGAWTYMVIKNIFSDKKLDLEGKRGLSSFFYLMLGTFTFFAAHEFLSDTLFSTKTPSVFEIINIFVMVILLIRSLISLSGLKAVKYRENMLVDQVADIQAKPYQVVFLICSSFIIFWFLKDGYTFLSQVVLIYFYTDTVSELFNKINIKKVFN